jgi:hypothetical protein
LWKVLVLNIDVDAVYYNGRIHVGFSDLNKKAEEDNHYQGSIKSFD